MQNNIVKTYVYRGRMVILMCTEKGYIFKINDKCNKGREYYSLPYGTFEQCEKESYNVAKKI